MGIFEKDEDIKTYINDSLGASLASKLKTTNQTMFNMMNEFYIRAINEKKTNSKGFLKVVNEFINCFGILCDMSTACSFLISDLLLKKYFNKVKHTCLDIDVTTNTPDQLKNIAERIILIVYNDQSVTIGNNNKIKGSTIASKIEEQ